MRGFVQRSNIRNNSDGKIFLCNAMLKLNEITSVGAVTKRKLNYLIAFTSLQTLTSRFQDLVTSMNKQVEELVKICFHLQSRMSTLVKFQSIFTRGHTCK